MLDETAYICILCIYVTSVHLTLTIICYDSLVGQRDNL